VLSNAEWLVRFDSSALAAWPFGPWSYVCVIATGLGSVLISLQMVWVVTVLMSWISLWAYLDWVLHGLALKQTDSVWALASSSLV